VEDFHFRAIEHARHTTMPLTRAAICEAVTRPKYEICPHQERRDPGLPNASSGERF
jgi:hypothetical protein